MFDAFYSDPHFGHKNIIGFCERPFKSLNEMHEAFVHNYNARITASMHVLWTGDALFKCDRYEGCAILSRLNGRKSIVRGNHDPSISKLFEVGFEMVAEELVLQIANEKCRVSHYPYAYTDAERKRKKAQGFYVDDRHAERRPPDKKDEWLIHGHTHSKRRLGERKMIHVGVDAWDYGPVLVDEVAAIIRATGV